MTKNFGIDAPLSQRSPTPDPREQSYDRLLALLEEADGPRFYLDCEIWRAVAGPYADKVAVPPAYTASIDAALTLLGPNWFWRAGHDGEGPDPAEFGAEIMLPTGHAYFARHATAPLALVIASLKARHAETPNG